MNLEQRHQHLIAILKNAGGGRMERLDLASACCKKSNLTIDWGYGFIADAVKDGIVEETYSGVTVHITLRPQYR